MSPEAVIKISVSGSEIATDAFHAIATEADKVAPALTRTSTASKGMTDATTESISAFTAGIPIIGGYLAAMSVERVLEFTAATIESAARIEDLSRATGISKMAFQQMSFVGKEFGVDAETMAHGVEQLSARLASGDASAVRAVQMLGLNLTGLFAAGPKEAFLQVAEATGRVEDPMLKAALASDEFGARLAKVLLPALGELREKLDAVPKSAIISDQNVTTAHELSVAWTHLKDVAGVVMTDLVVRTAEAFGAQTAAMRAATKAADEHTGKDIALMATTTLLKNQLTALRSEALVPLSDAQRGVIVELESYGVSQKEIAQLLGTTEIAVKRYTDALTAQGQAVKTAAAEEERVHREAAQLEAASILSSTKLWDEYNKLRVEHGGTANQIAIAEIKQWAADTEAAFRKANTDAQGYFDATSLNATRFYVELAFNSKEKMRAVGVDWDFLRAHSQNTLDEMARNARATYDEMSRHSSQFSREAMDEQLQKTHDAEDAARGMGKAYKDGLQAAAEKAKTLSEELKKVAEAAAKAAAENRAMGGSFDITRENFAATTRGMGGNEGLVEELLKKGYSFQQALLYSKHPDWPPPANPGPRVPGFAGGVENFGGGWAIVGERGPEPMYVPPGASIFPHGSGGGGSTTINVNVSGLLVSNSPAAKAEFGEYVVNIIRNELQHTRH